jgi:hypothetical protein
VRLAGDRITAIGKQIDPFDALDTGVFVFASPIFAALEESAEAGDTSLSGGVRRLAARGLMRGVDTGSSRWVDAMNAARQPGSSFRVVGPSSVREPVIFKPTDGVLARFNRRISIPISLVLIRTPITANQISVGIIGLGFWAAWLFSCGTYAASLLGAVVSLAASILDGCDGEVARLKYQESVCGCWLETVGDTLTTLRAGSG